MPPRVSERLVPIAEKPALAVLMTDYLGEMAKLIGSARLDAYPYFDLYWAEPEGRWPYWIEADAAGAGFALVRRREDGRFDMAEFYIAPENRRRGIGVAAARSVIARHPGPWSITQRETNASAIAFWHRVLDGFVAYDEATRVTDAARREQRFAVP